MKCFFCSKEITDECISSSRIHHEAELNDAGEVVKQRDDIVINMNFCSRECGIAEDIMFHVHEELEQNKDAWEAASKYDEDSTRFLSEKFENMRISVIEECNCTNDEFEDAIPRFLEVVNKLSNLADPDIDKYL